MTRTRGGEAGEERKRMRRNDGEEEKKEERERETKMVMEKADLLHAEEAILGFLLTLVVGRLRPNQRGEWHGDGRKASE